MRMQFMAGTLVVVLVFTSTLWGQPFTEVVVFGDSHKELIATHEGILFVNPGSPTYPAVKNRAGDLGTVAILSISQSKASAEIIYL